MTQKGQKKQLTEEQLVEKRRKHAEYMKRWYQLRGRKRDKAQAREYTRKYREEHLEECRERTRQWQEGNQDKILAYREAYKEVEKERYEENKADVIARAKAWREAHPEQYKAQNKAHYEENKVELLAGNKRRREEAIKAGKKPLMQRQSRESHLRRTFGMSMADYEALLAAAGGVCAICKQPETRKYKGTLAGLCVDHDHETGKIRGVLCHRCNQLAGTNREHADLLEKIIAYIRGGT